jgi:hypothetical protein
MGCPRAPYLNGIDRKVPHTGRFFGQRRKGGGGDEGDAALLIPRMRLRPLPSLHPPPPLRV